MLTIDFDAYDTARETLRDALRQLATHGETIAVRRAADLALDGLDLAFVTRALDHPGRYQERAQDAFLIAVRAGVFDAIFA